MEFVFLIVLAVIWVIFAIIQDFKTREIANWLNFSLIVFALIYRAFLSLFFKNESYIIQGLFGLAVFYVLANVFYYSRLFAGGDAKLLIALGPVLAFADNFKENVVLFLSFVILLLLVGSVYGLIYSFVLVLGNRKKFLSEFKKQFKKNKRIFYISVIIAIILLVFVLFINEGILVLLPVIIFVFPWLFTYAKAVEEACMLTYVSADRLTIGDWLAEEIKIKGKKIKPDWQGLTEQQLKMIQKNYINKIGKKKGKILIKQGIPFSLAFLIAFILLLLLRNSWLVLKEFF